MLLFRLDWGGNIFRRSSLLSLFLLVAIASVGVGSYRLWQEGPWELPSASSRVRASTAAEELKKEAQRPQVASTKEIIDRNLFDPERGTGMFREVEADSRAIQRIRSFVLKGTFIIGDQRYALITVPPDGGSVMRDVRVKLGDVFEGFKVAEIEDKRIVLQKGGSNVDLSLDFLRKVEVPAPRRPARLPVPPTPRVEPRSPAVSPPGAMRQQERGE